MTLHEWLAEYSTRGWPFIANHLWQATLFALLVFVATLLLKRGPARARYTIWLLASLKLVLPSALFALAAAKMGLSLPDLLSSSGEAQGSSDLFYQMASPITQLAEPVSNTIVSDPSHNEVFCLMTIVWMAGCVTLTVAWWKRRKQFSRAIKAGKKIESGREAEALRRVCGWLQIRREVSLVTSHLVAEPGVWRTLKPVVVLPESIADHLTDEELEAVMMHEMVHISRMDNLASNLHMMVCCLLWFHPLVWVIDRRLLSERESACDEAVAELGGAPQIYAASLLKVLRFCLGWKVAGVSGASGSNLKRRIEKIMATDGNRNLAIAHRVTVTLIAMAAVMLSLGAGIVSRDSIFAQSARKVERENVFKLGGPAGGVRGGVEGGVPGGVAGGVAGGVPGGVPGGILGGYHEEFAAQLEQAPEIEVQIETAQESPLIITSAKLKAVKVPQDAATAAAMPAEYVVRPVITLINKSPRRVNGFTIVFKKADLKTHQAFVRAEPFIEPNDSYTYGTWLSVKGSPEDMVVSVAGVLFEEGEPWGIVPPPPPPPPPYSNVTMSMIDQAPEVNIQVNNPPDAPLTIKDLKVKAIKRENKEGAFPPAKDNDYLAALEITFANNTNRRINSFSVEFDGTNGARSVFVEYNKAGVEPRGTYTMGKRGRIIFRASGNPELWSIEVKGVTFEDGQTWGKLPPPPPKPGFHVTGPGLSGPSTITSPKGTGPTTIGPTGVGPVIESDSGSKIIRKSGGTLMDSVIHRENAVYPPLAMAAKVTGSVIVEIVVDEEGKVESARAVSGHPLLKDAAVTAARSWVFTPTTLSGEAVKVVGTLTFDFFHQ